MRNLLNLNGALKLSKTELQSINGGGGSSNCKSFNSCQTPSDCFSVSASSTGERCRFQCFVEVGSTYGACVAINP